MLAKLFAISVCGILWALSPAIAETDLNQVVVTNYDPTNAQWTHGSLVVGPSHSDKELFLDFDISAAKEAFLSVHSDHWKIDLIKGGSNPSTMFPTRSQLSIYRLGSDGEADGFVISIPLSDGGKCLSRNFKIESHHLIQTYDSPTSPVRCEY